MRKCAFFLVVLAILAFQVGPLTGAQADVVGRLTQVEGRVDLLKGGQLPATPVKIDDGVQTGDVLRTKSLSKAQITFIDNSTLTLSPESRVVIEAYMCDPAQNKRNAVVQLCQGLAHVVVNKVFNSAEPDFVVKTHTAIMGVRGTEFGIRLHPNSSTILNFEGVLQVGNIFPEVGQLSRRAFKLAYSFGPPGSSNSVLLRGMQGTSVGRGMPPTLPFGITQEDRKAFTQQMSGGLMSRKGGRDSGGGEGGTKGGEGGTGGGRDAAGGSTAGGEGGTAGGGGGTAGGGFDGGSAPTFVVDQATAGTGTGTPTLGSFSTDLMANNANLPGGTVVGGATIASTTIASPISPQPLQPVTETPATNNTVIPVIPVIPVMTESNSSYNYSYTINAKNFTTSLPYTILPAEGNSSGFQATFTGSLPLKNSTVTYSVTAEENANAAGGNPGGFAKKANSDNTITWSLSSAILTGSGTSPSTGTVAGTMTATGTTTGGTTLNLTVPLTATYNQGSKLINVTMGTITGSTTVNNPNKGDYSKPDKALPATVTSATITKTPK